MISEPAFAKASRYGSHGEIIRCTSSVFLVQGLMHSTSLGPNVIFGTKCPSITSTWTQSHPASSMARTSSPKRAKSAERIEGAMWTNRLMSHLCAVGGQVENPARQNIGGGGFRKLGGRKRSLCRCKNAIGLPQPRAVERIADRTRIREMGVGAAPRNIAGGGIGRVWGEMIG